MKTACQLLLLMFGLGSSFTGAAQSVLAEPETYFILPARSGASNLEKPRDLVQGWSNFKGGREGFPPAMFAGLPKAAEVDFLMPTLASAAPDYPSQTSLGKLQRYLKVVLPAGANIPPGLLLRLRERSDVEHMAGPVNFSLVPTDPDFGSVWGFEDPVGQQWGIMSLSAHNVWDWSWGNAAIGVMDTGLQTNHYDLAAFSASGEYLGGNFLPNLAYDYAEFDANVDTLEPEPPRTGADGNFCTAPLNTPDFAGHGTHVAGIIAATTNNGKGVAGMCPGCRLIWAKIGGVRCFAGFNSQQLYQHALFAAMPVLLEVGSQVINLSFGYSQLDVECAALGANDPWCLFLAEAAAREVIVVAASGNSRTQLNFPARDPRTVAVGGIDSTHQLWDESPGSIATCPFPGADDECGSNFSNLVTQPDWRQELVGPSRDVLSTFDVGQVWRGEIGCMDDSQATPHDDRAGVGYCRGTSMSAPHVSGLFGLLRSLNPLLPAGTPNVSGSGLRNLVARTTYEAQAGSSWNPRLGYGRPDGFKAARDILGTIGGGRPANRPIPLFGTYSSTNSDFAYSTAPQSMVALALTGQYELAVGDPVSGYSAFPVESGHSVFAPRAAMYVLGGRGSFSTGAPATIALQRMAKFNSNGSRDYAYVTVASDIISFRSKGYALEKIEGYIYGTCSTPTSVTCAPAGTQALYRIYNSSRDDHALALSSQLNDARYTGYSVRTLIGFAYSSTDSDEGLGDGLPDGFETAVGLNPGKRDTDCDGVIDGTEWPIRQLPVSDPKSASCTTATLADLMVNYQTPLATNLSQTVTATNVNVRITVSSNSAFSASLSGPGSCTQEKPVSDPRLGYIYGWRCRVASLAAKSVSSWLISTSNCVSGTIGRKTIDILSLDQVDPVATNNSSSYTGTICGPALCTGGTCDS